MSGTRMVFLQPPEQYSGPDCRPGAERMKSFYDWHDPSVVVTFFVDNDDQNEPCCKS